MEITINNPRVESQLRELAKLAGEDSSEALEKAVAERLSRETERKRIERSISVAEVDRLVAELNALPILDDRAIEDILYDDSGLPR